LGLAGHHCRLGWSILHSHLCLVLLPTGRLVGEWTLVRFLAALGKHCYRGHHLECHLVWALRRRQGNELLPGPVAAECERKFLQDSVLWAGNVQPIPILLTALYIFTDIDHPTECVGPGQHNQKLQRLQDRGCLDMALERRGRWLCPAQPCADGVAFLGPVDPSVHLAYFVYLNKHFILKGNDLHQLCRPESAHYHYQAQLQTSWQVFAFR